LRFVQAFTSQGKPYYYFRKPGCARVKLPGLPGSEGFMAAYQAALAASAPPPDIGVKRSIPGTVAALVTAYISSDVFRDLAPETRRTRWAILQKLRDEHGIKRVALLRRQHAEAMLRARRPFPRQNLLKVLRPLIRFAISLGWHTEDPTRELTASVKRGPGFRPWGEDQINAFRAYHQIGTRARLAFELLLGTAQRRSDVIRMGPQHIRDGAITIRQQKTGTPLAIPILPEVQEVLGATSSGHLTFLATEHGRPFTAAGFGNRFRQWCDEAGLRGFSAHGLRHTACTRLAEAGATGHEIMSWSGHRTLKEVDRYTQSADQRALARSAEIKLATKLSKPVSHFDKTRKKASENKA
jgi:integrase